MLEVSSAEAWFVAAQPGLAWYADYFGDQDDMLNSGVANSSRVFMAL